MYVRERDHVRALSLLDAAAASSSRADLVVKVMPALRNLFHADEVGHAEVFTGTGQVASSVGFPTETASISPGNATPAARPTDVSTALDTTTGRSSSSASRRHERTPPSG